MDKSAEPRPVMGGEPSDALAIQECIDYAENGSMRGKPAGWHAVLIANARKALAALRPCAPSLNPSLSSDLAAPAPSGSGTGKGLA